MVELLSALIRNPGNSVPSPVPCDCLIYTRLVQVQQHQPNGQLPASRNFFEYYIKHDVILLFQTPRK